MEEPSRHKGTRVAQPRDALRSVRTACPLCGDAGPHPVLLPVRNLSPFNPARSRPCRIDVVRCSGCGLLRLDPRPDDESLEQMNRQGLGDAKSQLGCFETGNVNPKYPVMLARRLIESGFPAPGGALLDVGCGSGDLLAATAAILAAEGTGIDVSNEAVSRARKRHPDLDFRVASLRDPGRYHESFDAAVLIHVLEHLPEPVAALEALGSWLKPGGILAIEVPNGEFFFSRFYSVFLESPKPLIAAQLRAAGRRAPFTARGFYPYHLCLFGPDSLRATVERAGFDLLDLAPSTCGLQWRLERNLRSGNLLRFGVDAIKLRLARRGLGDNLLLLARRRLE